MKKILRRLRRWFGTRIVHCHTCGSTPATASSRIAPEGWHATHSHFTGHARVTVSRSAQ